ncbi:uncharacterized protein EI90DRAFT_3047270 [Cantharellus anzutake]|uniref:uncharacterized protein n=1 Tax=Cantharellus anzutake TaxID=1750568 RepID=UPI001906D69C|nr:uncharacterized protein EI90DRAFT_3047270 [Cantharellus anzutake]KAF8335832.1 hypothetical protein EI90DRAFT_3047270 [Cantharellus anzutake]
MDTVPLDIVCIILSFAEFGDVRSLSLLNRDCNTEANKLLWRHLHLQIRSKLYTEDARRMLEGFCEALIRDPQRAHCVHNLRITIKGRLWHGQEDPKVLVHTLSKLGRAMSYTRRLRVLQIFPRHHFRDIAKALSSASPSIQLPDLHTFESVISFSDGLERFMSESCPFVKTYRISGTRTLDCVRDFPTHLFPQLTTYSGTSSLLSVVLNNRPVHAVDCINSIPSSGVADLIQGLRSSSVSVTELSINVSMGYDKRYQENSTDGEVRLLNSLVETTPMLRIFELFSHGQFDDNRLSDIAMHRFATALGRLEKLESFNWWDARGPIWGQEFIALCREKCVSLNEIIINGGVLEWTQGTMRSETGY